MFGGEGRRMDDEQYFPVVQLVGGCLARFRMILVEWGNAINAKDSPSFLD